MQPKEKTKRNKTVIDISSTTESLSNIVTMEHVNIHGSSLERFKKPKNRKKGFSQEIFHGNIYGCSSYLYQKSNSISKASHSPFT